MQNSVSVRTTVKVKMDASTAFQAFVDELSGALLRKNMSVEKFKGGRVLNGHVKSGRVAEWETGKRFSIEMDTAPWQKEGITSLKVSFQEIAGSTSIKIDTGGIGKLMDGDAGESLGWLVRNIGATLVSALSSDNFTDWSMDRNARRPSGKKALSFYLDPLYHWPNFLAILDEIRLGPDDNVLEVGCGAGAFIREALKSGCRAACLDHSPEQIRAAAGLNADSHASGSLCLMEADAERLPLAGEAFTCAVMTGVFDFLGNPILALSEIRRCLMAGGRAIIFISSPSLKGTPAAPEPFASRLHFYEGEEAVEIARAAGFEDVRLISPDFYSYAKKVGIPDEAMEVFRGSNGGWLLRCTKGRGRS